MVNLKVAEVKKILESLSQMYEDKLKKNTFTQLERLMSILKARNKSIFI
jgi:ribosomal protein S17E